MIIKIRYIATFESCFTDIFKNSKTWPFLFLSVFENTLWPNLLKSGKPVLTGIVCISSFSKQEES